jgi:hypothetical protein
MNTAHFTAQAAAMVARNDRQAARAARIARIRAALAHAGRRVALLWSALALAAVVLSWSVIPVNVR